MTTTKCGVCGVHAVGRVEKFMLFGHIKGHMAVACTACRKIERNTLIKSRENEFRDRIEKCKVDAPRGKVNAHKLMEALNANEVQVERRKHNDFIGF
jgi:hypothetical protein